MLAVRVWQEVRVEEVQRVVVARLQLLLLVLPVQLLELALHWCSKLPEGLEVGCLSEDACGLALHQVVWDESKDDVLVPGAVDGDALSE